MWIRVQEQGAEGGAETDPVFLAASTSLGYEKVFIALLDLTTATATYSIVPAVADKYFVLTGLTTMLYTDELYDDGVNSTVGYDAAFSNCGTFAFGADVGLAQQIDIDSYTCTATTNTAFGVNVDLVGTGVGSGYVMIRGYYVP